MFIYSSRIDVVLLRLECGAKSEQSLMTKLRSCNCRIPFPIQTCKLFTAQKYCLVVGQENIESQRTTRDSPDISPENFKRLRSTEPVDVVRMRGPSKGVS